VPGYSTISAISRGDYKTAAIEGSIELGMVVVGVFTAGTGYYTLKWLRGSAKAARLVKATNKTPLFRIVGSGTDGAPRLLPKNAGSINLPIKGQKGFVKLRGNQGWKDSKGNIWKKDQLHKDHWDISDSKGNKIREIDFNGNQIWPGGPKNKNK
jgi:hypothetical protein